ncbi:hypothetical protein LLB_3437 [Legionella longbeachae D-4968]|nr:hypothetical protein LLB_3437 [Legionella longbeachae D-4968]
MDKSVYRLSNLLWDLEVNQMIHHLSKCLLSQFTKKMKQYYTLNKQMRI